MILDLHCDSGKIRFVETIRYGPFALHHTVRNEWLMPSFTLSHIQSRRAIREGLCCLQSALALARELRSLPVNWDFDVPRVRNATPPPEIYAELKRKVQPVAIFWKCKVHA